MVGATDEGFQQSLDVTRGQCDVRSAEGRDDVDAVAFEVRNCEHDDDLEVTMTAVIDEDDDSGYGVNPRISAQLLAGDYYVQIRHHERSGTGKYTIGVKKR